MSVVVVTWNAKEYVRECLQSLERNQTAAVETIVVDNASSDGTPELIADEFPGFVLVRNSANLGFARANNIGIRQSHGKYLCLVNSDVVLPAGCLDTLYRYMDTHPDVGMLGPQMLAPDGTVRRSTMRLPSLRNALGRALALDGSKLLSRLIGGQMMRDFSHNETREVEVLNGWFWVVRREAMEQVGVLDERFFIYGEDIDWCSRFRKAGWKLVFYPDASAIHYGAGSSRAAPVRFYVEMHRANMQYWYKHRGRLSVSSYRVIVFIHHLLRVAGYLGARLLRVSNGEEAAAKSQRSRAVLRWMMDARETPA